MNIAVDLDDVLAELIPALIALYAREDGVRLLLEAVVDWNVFPPHIHERMIASAYRGLVPKSGAREFVRDLRRAGHRIWVVTYRNPRVEEPTRAWLDRYFPGAFEGVVCTGGGKTEACRKLGVGLFVDDSKTQTVQVRNALGIPVILVTTPMNRDFQTPPGVYRARTLYQARDLALRLAGHEFGAPPQEPSSRQQENP